MEFRAVASDFFAIIDENCNIKERYVMDTTSVNDTIATTNPNIIVCSIYPGTLEAIDIATKARLTLRKSYVSYETLCISTRKTFLAINEQQSIVLCNLVGSNLKNMWLQSYSTLQIMRSDTGAYCVPSIITDEHIYLLSSRGKIFKFEQLRKICSDTFEQYDGAYTNSKLISMNQPNDYLLALDNSAEGWIDIWDNRTHLHIDRIPSRSYVLGYDFDTERKFLYVAYCNGDIVSYNMYSRGWGGRDKTAKVITNFGTSYAMPGNRLFYDVQNNNLYVCSSQGLYGFDLAWPKSPRAKMQLYFRDILST